MICTTYMFVYKLTNDIMYIHMYSCAQHYNDNILAIWDNA